MILEAAYENIESKWNQSENLADKIGVSNSRVSNWGTRYQPPRRRYYRKIMHSIKRIAKRVVRRPFIFRPFE